MELIEVDDQPSGQKDSRLTFKPLVLPHKEKSEQEVIVIDQEEDVLECE